MTGGPRLSSSKEGGGRAWLAVHPSLPAQEEGGEREWAAEERMGPHAERRGKRISFLFFSKPIFKLIFKLNLNKFYFA